MVRFETPLQQVTPNHTGNACEKQVLFLIVKGESVPCMTLLAVMPCFEPYIGVSGGSLVPVQFKVHDSKTWTVKRVNDGALDYAHRLIPLP